MQPVFSFREDLEITIYVGAKGYVKRGDPPVMTLVMRLFGFLNLDQRRGSNAVCSLQSFERSSLKS